MAKKSQEKIWKTMILMVKEKQNEEVDGSSPEQDVEEQNEKS